MLVNLGNVLREIRTRKIFKNTRSQTKKLLWTYTNAWRYPVEATDLRSDWERYY